MKKLLIWLTAIIVLSILTVNLTSRLKSKIVSSEALEEIGEEEEGKKETGVDKQMMMWFQARAYPDPYYLNEKYQSGWEQAQDLRARQYGLRTTSASWTSIGPNQTIGGRILSIAVDPTNGNKIFIGSASGGIWKTTTGGTGVNAWQYVPTNLPVLGVSSIIINPSNTNIIYAGTGEVYRIDSTGATPNPGNTGYNVWKTRGTYGIGIIKSTDGGVTWSQVYTKITPQLFAIQTLRLDPTNSNIVYAAATDGLYRSTDAGVTWNVIMNGTYITDVVVNAKNTNQIVCAAGNLGNAYKGIFRSTNGGTSWTKIAAGLPATFQGFIKFDNVTSVGNRDTIIASIGVSEAPGVNELYRSSDFGNTWTALTSSTHCSYQYWSAHDVAINPGNTDRLVYAGTAVHSYVISTTTTGGIAGIHADIHDIKYDPSNSNNAYIACDGGMYKSTNGGTSFVQINNGLGAIQFYASLGVSTTDPNLIIGGLQDNGAIMYNGATWSTLGWVGGDGTTCAIDPNNDNNMIGCRDARGIYRSTNKGVGGGNVATYWGTVADSRTAFVAPVAYSKSNPSILYAISDNLHKSVDGGATWTNNAYGSATQYVDALHKTGIAVAVSPTNSNKVYVSTSPFAQFDNDADGLFVTGTPNVLKTTNGTTPFTSIKGTLPNRFVMDFAISRTFDDSVFIVLSGFVGATGTSHVYVTGNGGTTWTAIGGGLPDVPFNAILIDPVNPQILYAGGDLGVYVSPNRGGVWYDFNNGLSDVTQVMDLQVLADGQLVAATHGRGAFRSARYTSTLPVNLISFTGVNDNGVNTLRWTTDNESNLKQYELEKSLDGISFTKITTVPAINQNGTQNYQYNDPVNNQVAGIYHYRLKSIDLDGTSKYSRVITLEVQSKKSFQVLNNPFTESIKVNVELTNRQSIFFNLYDAHGRLLKKQENPGEVGMNAITIDNLGHFSKGNYILEAIIERERYTIRLSKIN